MGCRQMCTIALNLFSQVSANINVTVHKLELQSLDEYGARVLRPQYQSLFDLKEDLELIYHKRELGCESVKSSKMICRYI